MPSSVGHALAGATAGLLAANFEPTRPLPPDQRRPFVDRDLVRRVLLYGGIATLPDLDLLWGMHSAQTHSLTAAVIVGLVVAMLTSGPRLFMGATTGFAYATHVLLDWLGNDGSQPFGVMAFWPFSRRYFESNLHVFMAIERRYYLPGFWQYNLRAIAAEVVILSPPFVAALLIAVWKKRRGNG